MQLVTYPNEILTTPCEKFDFINPQFDPHTVSQELINYCHKRGAVSMSANQIGLPFQMFVLVGTESFACFNPRIIHVGREELLLEESCLSFPGLNVKIKRPGELRLRFETPSGGTTTKTFHGLTARMIQHEMDHLAGIPFWQRANRFHREQAFNKRDKMMRKLNDKNRAA